MNMKKLASNFLISVLLGFVLIGCSSSEDRQEKYFERAQALYDSGDYEKAKVEVRNVLQINSDHPQARYLLALIHERGQNWREMFGNLQAAVDLDPNFVDARIRLGQIYYRSQAYDEAIAQAEAVLALDKSNADAHALLGSSMYRQGDYEAAIEQAQLALAAEPGHVGAISILTEVYKEKDPDQALAIIGQGIDVESENAVLRLLKISVLEEQGDTEGVIREYRELIAEHPDEVTLYYQLVKYLEQHERIDEAEGVLQEVVTAIPDNSQLKLLLVEFLARHRSLELAESAITGFIAEQPESYELRFALVKIYSLSGKYAQAEDVLVKVVALDEKGADSLQARNQLIKLKLGQGERDEAVVLLDEIFAIEEQNTDALITRARLAVADGDASAAIADLRSVIKNEPESVQGLLLLAQAHEITGSQDLALDNYRNVLALAPGNAQAVLKVSALLVAKGEYEAADQMLEGFLIANPGSEAAGRLLAESYSKQERWDDALGVARTLEEQDQTAALGMYLRGRVQYMRKDYASSVSTFEQVLELEPTAMEVWPYLIQGLIELGQEDKAFDFLTDHIKRYPELAHTHEAQGTLYMRKNEVDAAIASYESAVSADPSRLSSHIALARAYQAKGDSNAALDAYDAALNQSPRHTGVMIYRAGVLESLKDYEAAAEQYEAVLAIDSEQVVAVNNLAMILVDNLPSEENFERALEITRIFDASKEPVFLDTRGWVYYQVGDYARALPLLKKAVSAEHPQNVFHYHLGMTYYKLEDLNSAKAEMAAALEMEGDFPGREMAEKIAR